MPSTEEILKNIIGLQKTQGYSDQQMAEQIGCSRPLYQRTRTGKIPIGGTFLKGALKLLATPDKEPVGRKAEVIRKTAETSINLELDIDGCGKYKITTGVAFFDHLLSQLARHGLIDIILTAKGDDVHHLVEDVAICLGQAFGKALGEKRGIVRMADASVPMDETLANVAADISGRGYAVINLNFSGNDISGLPAEMVRHFLESFAIEARINLHAAIAYGSNDHHKAEVVFKALGCVLARATRLEPRRGDKLPSTKGHIE